MTNKELRIEWIKKHIEDIETNNWEKFYMDLDNCHGKYETLYYQVGCITDILLAAEINPLDSCDIIYPNMFVCSKIETLHAPHIKMLGRSAFYNSNLKYFIIPDGVKDIPMECFEGCHNLQWVQIPPSVVRISADAFPIGDVDFILKVHKDSFADRWAFNYDLKVEYIK